MGLSEGIREKTVYLESRKGTVNIFIFRRAFFMVDSTYTNPSDPNSMRDMGQGRNVEYNFQDQNLINLQSKFSHQEILS